ncbi:Phd_YefM [Sorangium cellulosum]|uniref:Phd_YefM n=1 Tax=Sorangium cellulosum TaxID=56 RepID=A0A2L0EJR0_SORCE|nr:Phd_YefM [Sorangium cellulosum]
MPAVIHVEVTEIRQNLPSWLERVRGGEEVAIIDRGRVMARLVPPVDRRAEARRALEELRARARVGDVESPVGEAWSAADDPP